ncbi:phytoene dehydrogenase-like protein [Streptomyces albogriseolus]|uniref:Phytoene dehydrogenase-like protein n=1 Tax=Streptomyces albogriseolus TaxID=1887 RepID=A0ACC6UWM6_STRAO
MSHGTRSEGAPRTDGPVPPGRHAVVVGGGLAGTTAALALADAGVRVTLLEGRPRLGGLAFSFRRGDLTVDNGQHVYLRCCTAYRWFLDRIGGADLAPLQDRLDVPVVDARTVPRAGGWAGCGATRCRCPSTSAAASPRTPTSRSPTGPGWAGPRSR